MSKTEFTAEQKMAIVSRSPEIQAAAKLLIGLMENIGAKNFVTFDFVLEAPGIGEFGDETFTLTMSRAARTKTPRERPVLAISCGKCGATFQGSCFDEQYFSAFDGEEIAELVGYAKAGDNFRVVNADEFQFDTCKCVTPESKKETA